ncbi:MAG: MAPEG family protein [Gammaproteobacteria bacterium]|nr:MAPEG family protein [Gammaproteobacteria bacterium]NND58890.1 MAPEG family protein [Gammaproteobacteria bacterium]
MSVLITAFYAGLLGLLTLVLGGLVVRQRFRSQVGIGDGGDSRLSLAIRVHGNFIENVPLALLLLLVAEMTAAPTLLLHGCGIALVVARLLHAFGLSRSAGTSPGRFVGTATTWIVIAILALVNLYHGSQALFG